MTPRLAFVIVSLAVLVPVPVLVGSRTSAQRAEVDDGSDPTRALVTRTQFSMARELATSSPTPPSTPPHPATSG